MNIGKRVADSWDFYYGWIIVAIGFFSMAFWLGIRSSFSIFYVALLDEFPWDRGGSAGVQSMALITYTVLSPLVGGLIDRFGPRCVIVPGILILTAGLGLCSTIKNLSQFYLFYGIIVGGGVTFVAIISYTAILAHWFEKKRGLASGIAVSGSGVGTFILVPLSQYLISVWGWRLTFSALGVLVLIILFPLNAIFLRHKPEEIGQYKDGAKEERTNNNENSQSVGYSDSENDWTVGKVFHSGRFWALITFSFLSTIATYTLIVHHVKFLVDQGVDRMTAAFVFAIAGVICSFFRIFWGWLSDRIGREMTFTIGIMILCISISILILFEAIKVRGLIYVFLVFFGMGWAVAAPIFMTTSADLFSGRAFGLIYGFVEGGIGIAGALGSWLPGLIFDKTQSYRSAFMLAIAVSIISCFFIWIAAPRKKRD